MLQCLRGGRLRKRFVKKEWPMTNEEMQKAMQFIIAQEARSSTKIDALGEKAKSFGAKGLAWVKVTTDRQLESVIAKFLNSDALLRALPEVESGDLILFAADQPYLTSSSCHCGSKPCSMTKNS